MNGITILEGDCRETLRTLPDNSVHCCVTSPPYFGLRDYGHDGQIGLEQSPLEFIAELVKVFEEVKRVLREDGSLWLNLGDSYAGSWGAQGKQCSVGQMADRAVSSQRQVLAHPKFAGNTGTRGREIGLKPKDLMGIPWRVAFALQEHGWYLRQDIIWHKPNPMPESVQDRCTKAHEYLFLLTKSPRYYFDCQAISEPVSGTAHSRGSGINPKAKVNGFKTKQNESFSGSINGMVSDRNKRSVWTVTTKPHKGAHFATFPPDLIEPCILAGTSEHGCCSMCGTPWRRITEKTRKATRPGNKTKIGRVSDDAGSLYETHSGMVVGNRDPQRHCTVTTTIGWEAGCNCENAEVVPCVVLDPFNGSGTTGQVARDNGCHYIGCELNPEYIALTNKRLQQGSLLV